ncbi:DUF2975 domain-containing protein [Actinomadura macrotermitis]|uniref:DUF2975 domain-containing protein n=1 Tax=Actinomadura macrotermitis TaxID=2585200 RepID=A0A7K0C1C9_9ACTN|nr:DUF2975 domain-containing protein [Actinomadura macrotermitis]MQY07273.1 hypothetical protein [Actinomadura macrotermitis]
MRTKTANPLAPLGTLVSLLAPMALLFTVFGVLASGGRDVCAVNDSLSIGGPDTVSGIFKPGVSYSNSGVSMCVHHAGPGLRLLDRMTEVPSYLLYGGAALLLWLFVQSARRHGPFARSNARWLRSLGWWLAGGGVLAASAEAFAHTSLLRAMLLPDSAPDWRGVVEAFPVPLVVTGLGLLTMARILRVGTAMHEDLEGTV